MVFEVYDWRRKTQVGAICTITSLLLLPEDFPRGSLLREDGNLMVRHMKS